MKAIDHFIRTHDVDIAKTAAGLLFLLSLLHVYAVVFGLLTFCFDARHHVFSNGVFGFFLAMWLAISGAAYGEYRLAKALWKHRPIARNITAWCLWIIIVLLAMMAILGPMTDEYKITLPGFSATNPADWIRIVFPCAMAIPVIFLLLAFECPATKERFKNA